jgi:hypothetical protein
MGYCAPREATSALPIVLPGRMNPLANRRTDSGSHQ